MTVKTLIQVREEGLSMLMNSLGPADTVRFLQQFDAGHGDYTKDRKTLLGNPTVDQVVTRIEEIRKAR